MYTRIDADSCYCPEHGEWPALLLLSVRGMEPWEAQVELTAMRLHWWLYQEFNSLRAKILHPGFGVQWPHYLTTAAAIRILSLKAP